MNSCTLVLSLLLITASFATIPLNFYVDPTSQDPLETGDIEYPFRNLSSAFLEMEKAASLPQFRNQKLSLDLYLKEETIFNTFGTLSIVLDFKDFQRFMDLKVTIQTYSSNPDTRIKTKTATFLFSDPSDHLVIRSHVMTNISNIKFQFDVRGEFSHPELILLETGDANFINLENCEFSDFQILSKGLNSTIFHLKDRINIIQSIFKNISSDVPIFSSISSRKPTGSMLRLKENQIKDLKLQEGASFLKTKNISHLLFSRNSIEETSGVLFDVTFTPKLSLSGNSFRDIEGKFPLRFNGVANWITRDNSISFTQTESECEGVISLTDSDYIELIGFSLEEYHNSLPAIAISRQGYLAPFPNPHFLKMQDSIFKKNFIEYGDSNQLVSSLINFEFETHYRMTIINCTFSENTIGKKNHDLKDLKGSSTLWIEAPNSSIEILESKFMDNEAEYPFKNTYVNVSGLHVRNSTFSQNKRIGGSDILCRSENEDCSGFSWFGKEMRFEGNLFQEEKSQAFSS